MSPIIAIDGPAAAGKGTLALSMAQELDFAFLDTGVLYRAVALKAAEAKMLENAGDVARDLQPSDMDHPELRQARTGELASQVAAQPDVRLALFNFQRSFGLAPPDNKKGAVLDGRDIGTVIFPEATLKLFVTASAEVRARRRFAELDPDIRPSFESILSQVRSRDARDAERTDSPMIAADDAHLIDTSEMNPKEVLNLALSIWRKSR